jgi:hypothetical protein
MYLRTAIILAMLAVAGNAADLNIGQEVLSAGHPATVNVSLASGGAALTGLQFDLEYDATLLNVTVSAGASATQGGKNVQPAVISPGKLRVLIVGLNRNTITDGVVAVLNVSLKGSAEASRAFPIRMIAPVGTTASAQSVKISSTDGSVKVASAGNAQ